MDSATIDAWMREAGAAVAERREELTALDAAIGDGDHGTNMARGFAAVNEALVAREGDEPPGKVLILAGKTLVSKVGGASGPLWGTFLRRAGRSLGSDSSEFDDAALTQALRAGLDGVVELGKAEPGDKTMVDALTPAVEALENGGDLEAAAAAAEQGAEATVPMEARKGRASYLGPRSVGHADPGATSVGVILRALQRAT